MRYDDYKNKNCLIFGANGLAGKGISGFLSHNQVNLGLVDLESHEDPSVASALDGSPAKVIYRTVPSGDRAGFKKVAGELDDSLGGLDYLICSYYLEEVKADTDPESLTLEAWDHMFRKWLLNYFLVMKAVVPKMIKTGGGRIIFVTTTAGYTGEGEGEGQLAGNGSIYENACASGITGMMTSIARDIIPQGVSVNGIALGPGYETDMERIIWATHLWLSGMGEYSCAQILRLY